MVNTIICSFLIAWLGFFCGVLAENLRQEAKRARAKKKLIEIIDGMLDDCQMIKQPTEADLRAVLYNTEATEDQKEYAREKLNDIKIAKMRDELKKENATQTKQSQEQIESARAAIDLYPDLEDNKSELYKAAEQEFIRGGLDRFPDGMLIAAERAARKLEVAGPSKKQIERKLAKATQKTSLASGGAKVTTTSDAADAKLREKAIAAGYGSKEWNDWQKSIVTKRFGRITPANKT